MSSVDYSQVPVDYMIDGVKYYIEKGIPPGGFLTALFSNDLKLTFRRADDNNLAAIHEWVKFMYWEMPHDSHGSPEAVAAWCKKRQALHSQDAA